MEIQLAEVGHVPAILEIYEKARCFMQLTGNPRQWRPGYPSRETLLRDIAQQGSYVCLHEGRVVATFFFVVAPEPTYSTIESGEWLSDEPYGVIHRVASDGTQRGVMTKILDYCFARTGNIRIDTHRDNRVMQAILLRYGFRYCGVIHLADGSERLAYQRIC